MDSGRKGLWSIINKQVFIPPAIPLIIAVVLGLVNPEEFSAKATVALSYVLKTFSWFYAGGTAFLIIFCLWAGFSKYGNIKFGGPDAKPTMSTFNWFAISLCAGLAIGLVFYAVGEPMTHYLNPAPFLGIEAKSSEAAQYALQYTFLHWSFHPYAIYVSAAVCIGIMFYNNNKPFRVSSSLYPLLGNKVNGFWGNLVDGLAIFAIVGGVGTSLGFGTMQIAGGMKFLWGIEPSDLIWLGIIVFLTICYTISSYTGLHKGIKLLSQYNVYIYFLLLGWVLIFGPTTHILDSTMSAIGDYFSNLVSMSLFLEPVDKSGWVNNWTIFYWAWWSAFAPIVGLFMIRLGYGRTVREFIIVNLIAPASFGILWFATFGSASIYFDHFLQADIGDVITANGIEVSLFALLEHLPLPTAMIIFGVVAVIISFITLADSMTSTIASMTTLDLEGQTKEEAPTVLKIFWGIGMGLLSWVLMISGGTSALQTSVVVVGLPILVLLIAMAISYIKAVHSLSR